MGSRRGGVGSCCRWGRARVCLCKQLTYVTYLARSQPCWLCIYGMLQLPQKLRPWILAITRLHHYGTSRNLSNFLPFRFLAVHKFLYISLINCFCILLISYFILHGNLDHGYRSGIDYQFFWHISVDLLAEVF